MTRISVDVREKRRFSPLRRTLVYYNSMHTHKLKTTSHARHVEISVWGSDYTRGMADARAGNGHHNAVDRTAVDGGCL